MRTSNRFSEKGIFALMFTKRQLGYRGDYWVSSPSGNCCTHGVIGYLLYAKRPRHEQQLAIMGGILPDVFLALGFVAPYLGNSTNSAMAAELHTLLHHSVLHTVTIAMHSFVLVGPCLALSSLFYRPALPFFVADVRSYRSVEDGPLLDSRDNTTVFRPSYFDDYESH